MSSVQRVALAYSGGLDTSVMIPWLRERYACEVVAVVADVGQRDDFGAVRDKALRTGASLCQVVDLKDTFARECLFPALRAGAVYEGRYLLGTALARPVIARCQVEVAHETGCDALAHGCTGKGNDQVRFELAYRALAPELTVIAPWREWEIGSREDAMGYAAAHAIPVEASLAKPYSIDRNLWHTSFEGGVLEDPGVPPPDDLFDLTVDPLHAPELPGQVEIGFEAGLPVSLDGEALEPAELIAALNEIAGAHGVGRIDMVENRLVGIKSRGVYETPAGTVLMAALEDLESITLDRDTVRFRRQVAERYADLAYQGLWYSHLRTALDAFTAASQRPVTGSVTLKLYKGSCLAVARSSPFSLYREDLATFGADVVYDQGDAAGFIKLWGLPAEVQARVHRSATEPGTASEIAVEPGTADEDPTAASGEHEETGEGTGAEESEAKSSEEADAEARRRGIRILHV